MNTAAQKNALGIVLMVLAMAAFAGADTLIKFISGDLSIGHTLLFLVGGTALVFTVLAKTQGAAFLDRRAFAPILLARYVSEIAGMFGMVIALAMAPLSTVGAIIQVTPLMVTLGAVFFLGERVSPRQWGAIAVGFVGVLFVMQPTASGFDPSVLWAVVAMLGLSGRDLTTRMTPPGMPSSLLAAFTMIAAFPFAVLWCLFSEPSLIPASAPWPLVIAMIGCGALAYLLLIASIRSTEVSVVAPFRYARLIFLLVLGALIFGERPDIWVLLGSCLIVGSGIYMMWLGRQL